MKSSPGAKAALVAALLLTLGAKAAWTRDAPPPDAALFVARAERLLRAEGFAVQRFVRPFETMLFAARPGCTLMVAEYPPNGVFAEALASHARPVGPLSYVRNGAITSAPPKLVPLAEFYLQRELGRMGFRLPRHPITAVAASPGCDPAALDWTPLASLPR